MDEQNNKIDNIEDTIQLSKIEQNKHKNKSNKHSKSKKEKTENRKHKNLWKYIKRIFLIIILVALIVAGIIFAKLVTMFKEARINASQIVIPYENSVVKDRNGTIIAVLSGDENRENISISKMSPYLPKAFVAIEDERFYEHSGVDIKRTTAATVKYVFSKLGLGSASYGGSTITQQLIKNSTKEDERSWERKVKEISRAYYLEKELSKEQILELYLNLIFLGGNTYGVEIASNYYFNKSTSELTLAESAFLAGINHSPNSYNPFYEEDKEETLEDIKSRTKTVLWKMKELGAEHKAGITEEEYNIAIEEVDKGLPFNKGEITQTIYSYHTDATIEQVIDELMEMHPDWSRDYTTLYVKSSGLTIYTTQDTNLQKIMEEEFADSYYQIKSEINVDEEGNPKTSQAAMVLIDHTTGQVVATVGGLGEKTTAFGLNRATQSLRQTGSAMKPLAVLVPGIDQGILTPATVYDDVPTNFGNYPIKNSTGYKGLVTLRYAVASSQNVPMVAGLRDIGINTSVDYLEKLGITSLVESDYYLGLALGGLTNGITPLEMAGAYATIANDGVYIEPTFYTKVVDGDGNIILETNQESRTVMSKAAAYVVKEMLTQTVKSGTSTYCWISGMSVVGKTGTTSDDFDRWMCGFTPYYTASCWFGFDQNEEVIWWDTNPSGLLWSHVMDKVHEGLESKYFADTRPEGVTSRTICKSSGKLATEFCKRDQRGDQTYTEYFVSGTAPTEYCSCHKEVSICKDTGKIANEYCKNIEKKVFITRTNVDDKNAWSMADDAKYTLTIKDTCTKHKKTETENKIDDKENTITNSQDEKTSNTVNNTINTNNVIEEKKNVIDKPENTVEVGTENTVNAKNNTTESNTNITENVNNVVNR